MPGVELTRSPVAKEERKGYVARQHHDKLGPFFPQLPSQWRGPVYAARKGADVARRTTLLQRTAYCGGLPSTMYSLSPERKMIAPSAPLWRLTSRFELDGSPLPPLINFELFHIDVYALITGKLPNRAWRTPIVGQAPHVHVVVVPGVELATANVDAPAPCRARLWPRWSTKYVPTSQFS